MVEAKLQELVEKKQRMDALLMQLGVLGQKAAESSPIDKENIPAPTISGKSGISGTQEASVRELHRMRDYLKQLHANLDQSRDNSAEPNSDYHSKLDQLQQAQTQLGQLQTLLGKLNSAASDSDRIRIAAELASLVEQVHDAEVTNDDDDENAHEENRMELAAISLRMRGEYELKLAEQSAALEKLTEERRLLMAMKEQLMASRGRQQEDEGQEPAQYEENLSSGIAVGRREGKLKKLKDQF